MKTVIIDDEPKGRITLKNYISKYAPNLDLVGEAESVASGLKLIEDKTPDLVFLDIQMPDGTGFDLLGMIPEADFKVIFCTAFDQYAVKAFRFSALDYLLKPIDPDVFMSAIKKVSNYNSNQTLHKQIDLVQTNQTEFTRIALHTSTGIDLVNIEDIIRCESSGNYTNFHLKNEKQFLVTKTLKDFDELLSGLGFLRIHKSHLINLKYVSAYLKNDGGWVRMSDSSMVEVSRRRKEALLTAISKS